jgi:hypothetical protein
VGADENKNRVILERRTSNFSKQWITTVLRREKSKHICFVFAVTEAAAFFTADEK